MRIFLHIGMSKAGSSAIQQMLAQHQEDLLNQGICFPETGLKRAHYELLRSAEAGQSADLIAKCIQEAEAKATDRLVLSAEGFWLLDEPKIRQLRADFQDHSVEAIIYLRRPGDYLRSSFRQGIKRRGKSLSPQSFLADAKEKLDYPQVLKTWSDYFDIRARSYDRLKLDLENDFLNAISATIHQPIPRSVVNSTPSDGATRVMYFANKILPYQLARAVRRRILAKQKLFSWLPAIDNKIFMVQGDKIAEAWDVETLGKFLTSEDLESLTVPSSTSEA